MPDPVDVEAPPWWRRRRLIGVVLLLALTGLAGWTASRIDAASDDGYFGKEYLEDAEAALRDGDIDGATEALDRAERSFRRARQRIGQLGPVAVLARQVPFVRSQVRAAEVFADIGLDLTAAARELTAAARRVLEPEDDADEFSDVVTALREGTASLESGLASLERAVLRMQELDGRRLVGRLGQARVELAAALEPAIDRAHDARRGLRGALAFLGADGDRRWLVVSQNPDEPRPLGGFIGTVGLLEMRAGTPVILQHEGVDAWQDRHPTVFVAPDDAPTPFSIPTAGRVPQYLANVNATFDWRASAALAIDLWERAGEPRVDGVLSLTPETLARLLSVLGPVEVSEYPGEVLTEANLVERLDYHTHGRGAPVGSDPALEAEVNSKRFVAASAEAILELLVDAPASQYLELAEAFARSFDRREALGWARDPTVATALTTYGWDGRLPPEPGDLLAYGEFAFAGKNGRSLRRTFDHVVRIDDRGTAEITTEIRIENRAVFHPVYNPDALAYAVVHGPRGADLAADADEFFAREPAVGGHPGFGWLTRAQPGSVTTIRVAWEVPDVLVTDADGRLGYGLRVLRVIGNRDDRLHLRVELPDRWRWEGDAPDGEFRLNRDVDRFWAVAPVADEPG